jgi:hypothetical protein
LDLWNFATHQNLVEEVLDELLLQRSGGKQAVEIGSEELGDKVAGRISSAWVCGDVAAYMSSRGEMKMSLRLMI